MSATIRGEGVCLITRLVNTTLTGAQLRAARALANLSQPTLALESGVSVETIKRFERFRMRAISARPETIERLIGALRGAGIELLGSDYPGVRVIPLLPIPKRRKPHKRKK